MKKDVSFLKDAKGNPIIISGSTYIRNIINILFMMVPGMDEYNLEKGLNIRGKMNSSKINGERDVEYENEIRSQFSAYTDLVVSNVVVLYRDGKVIINMEISNNENEYRIVTDYDSNDLSILIQ